MNTKRILVVTGVSLALVAALGAGVLIGGIAGQSAFAQGPVGGQPGFGAGMMGRGLGLGAGYTGTVPGGVTGAFTGTMPCLTGVAGQAVPGAGVVGFGRMGGAGGYGYDEVMLPALAKALGMTQEQLQAQFAAGKSALDIATAKGISAQKLQADFLAAHKVALQQLVKDGKLTQAQADLMQDRADDFDHPFLTGTVTPGTGLGRGAAAGGRGGRGMMGRSR